MKRLCLLFAAIAACVSCEIHSGRSLSSTQLDYYSKETLDRNLGDANRYFRYIECAGKYLAYTDPDRELQWFSRYLSAEAAVNMLTINPKGYYPTLKVHTNGLPFDKVGSEYSVEGFTFKCVGDGETPVWSVTSTSMESELKINVQGMFGIEYQIKGKATDAADDPSLVSEITFDFLYNWNFADDMTYYPSYYFMKDGVKGKYEVQILHNGKVVDWVRYTSGTVRTSRD